MTDDHRPRPSLQRNPRIATWLTIGSDGRVAVRSGKVELGQGVLTALAQIAAEELDVDVARVEMIPARTGVSPDEAYTNGSMSIQHSGDALRQACACARAAYLEAAAAQWGCDAHTLRIADGDIIAVDGRRTSYWALADDALLDRVVDEAVRPKAAEDHNVVGRSQPRVDLADKLSGRPRYIHDMRLPGQLFGRVVRPPARGAVLTLFDEAAAQAVPGVVVVVRDGNFLGVVAEREDAAIRACEVLRTHATWSGPETLPAQSNLAQFLAEAPAETTVLEDTATAVSPSMGPSHPQRTIAARFSRGYIAHASLAPSCGVAVWRDAGLHVWSHTQGVYPLQRELAHAFGLAATDVVVEHVEGAGCYGHNAADDAAYDAALLAHAVPGRAVQVVWSRQDELTWSPMGPAMVVDVEVDVDADGRPQAWRHEVWTNGHTSRPGRPGSPLLGAQHRAGGPAQVAAPEPPIANGGGGARNAVPLYDLPALHVVLHRVLTMPLRTSALRALGAHLNVYAIESVVDDLALAAGVDPVKYRLAMLSDERARAVIEAVAERSGWHSPLPKGDLATGRGIGIARYKNVGAYCAVVAEVEAETQVRVRRLTVAADLGLVINPDGAVNQLEGGAIQATSWTTLEQVHFDRTNVTSQTWQEYPILTFEQAPAVDVVLVDRPDMPPVGSGEATTGPTAAAIGNAVAAALGVRVRTLPLTPSNVVAAFEPTR